MFDPIRERYIRDMVGLNDSFFQESTQKIIDCKGKIDNLRPISTLAELGFDFKGRQVFVLCRLQFVLTMNKYCFDNDCFLFFFQNHGMNAAKITPYYRRGYAEHVPAPLLEGICGKIYSADILIKEEFAKKGIAIAMRNPKFYCESATGPTVRKTLKILEDLGFVRRVRGGVFDDGMEFPWHDNAYHWTIYDEFRQALQNWFDEHILAEKHNIIADIGHIYRKTLADI